MIGVGIIRRLLVLGDGGFLLNFFHPTLNTLIYYVQNQQIMSITQVYGYLTSF